LHFREARWTQAGVGSGLTEFLTFIKALAIAKIEYMYGWLCAATVRRDATCPIVAEFEFQSPAGRPGLG
jgi:hypothetical protein